jgi:hypothetical protein
MSVLSRVSNYRFNDWLRAFGFNLEDIPRLQVFLPSNRTVLLNSSLDDLHAWIPWLENRPATPQLLPSRPWQSFWNSPITGVFTHCRNLGQKIFCTAKSVGKMRWLSPICFREASCE